MKIESAKLYDITTLGLPKQDCEIYIVHVKIINIKGRAKEIIDVITDTSWISKLGVIEQISYAARASKTIDKLVNEILAKVDNSVTEEFGEYLVSDSAALALVGSYNHVKIPLAELWKEQAKGNPGFDFHTVSPAKFIVYGEAKYKAKTSPYTVALEQIGGFITDNKDEMDLIHLKNLVEKEAIDNALAKKKGYVAAFSLNAKNANTVFENALKSEAAKNLYNCSQLYLIGIEVCS